MNRTQIKIAREVSRVRLSLQTLDKALRGLAPLLAADVRNHSNGATQPAVRVSSKARASLILQGRYMGYMRQLKPRQKVRVRKIREAKGVRAAIATARRFGG